MLLCAGCQDDLLYDYEDPGEGERDIEMIMQFTPMNAVTVATRATAGDAIEDIRTLSIAMYDAYGNLIHIYNPGDSDMTVSEQEDVKVTVADEIRNAKQVKVKLNRVAYGRYRIYAVANAGRPISEDEAKTEDDFRNITFEWNADNVAANNQMYGFFNAVDAADSQKGLDKSFNLEGTTVTVSDKHGSFHSWLHRLASKVTVDFDTSKLKPDVSIYIKSITVKDIPKTCKLGYDNAPEADDQLIATGESTYYQGMDQAIVAPTTYKEGLWLSRGRSGPSPDSIHADDAPALYFFENMQGDYEGLPAAARKVFDKRQQKDKVGTNITASGQDDFKDEVPYGTYIEIEAYYLSLNQENSTNGEITYRFMLGQNETYNYNARRNNHYKVTLGFNGWANQPDWHINYYEEDPSIIAPVDFLVSYSYNTKAELPIKVNGNCTSLKAEIIRNNWNPYDPSYPDSIPPQNIGQPVYNLTGEPDYDFEWNRPAYEKLGNRPYLGFLALHVPGEKEDDIPAGVVMEYTQQGGENAMNALKAYYESNHQNARTYEVAPGTYGKPGANNAYEVKNLDATDDAKHEACPNSAAASRQFILPLWTRNKTMIATTGFSGANPYNNFQRNAKLLITATFIVGNGTKVVTRSKIVNVIQVRRIENPAGVWRPSKDQTPFKVQLTTIPTAAQSSFKAFASEGEWKAYVEAGDKNAIRLSGGNETSQNGDTIYGYTGTIVDFDINFTSVAAPTDPHSAVIKVEYHGYTCNHRILVRQGYEEPVMFAGAEWSNFCAYSMYSSSENPTKLVPTASPLSLGTLFKWRRFNQGILISNNYREPQLNWGPLGFPDNGDFDLVCADPSNPYSQLAWDDILRYGGFNETWGDLTADNGFNYRVPTYDQFKALNNNSFACGVVYGHGALGTQLSLDGAYGFYDPNNDDCGGVGSPKGTRCIICYDPKTAFHILFPLGAHGMGRRTQFNCGSSKEYDAESRYGQLRYADVWQVLSLSRNANNLYRPIPYDLPRCPGAIYWIDKQKDGGYNVEPGSTHNCRGWDMNYFSLDFNPYTPNNGDDACPIKLVLK